MDEYFQGKVKVGGKVLKWESSFPKTTSFECTRCALCCNGTIGLTEKDIVSLEKKGLGDKIAKEVQQPSWAPYDSRMKNQKNGMCTNLQKSMLCGIYKDRPMVCKTFPFMLTAGFEGNLVMDVVLRCPYFNIQSEKKSKGKGLDSVANLYAKNIPDQLLNTVGYQTTLANHIYFSVPIAFLPKSVRYPFMDKAIELLRVDSPDDIVSLGDTWADEIAASTNRLIFSGITEPEQVPPADELLKDVAPEVGKYKFKKAFWKGALTNPTKNVLLMGEKYLGAENAGISEKGVNLGKETYSFKKLSNVVYSNDAMSLLIDYLKLMVRRSSFQLAVARTANFVTDYMSVGISDFTLETGILDKGVIENLDVMSRLLAVKNGHDAVNAADMRMAIANRDMDFMLAFTDGSVSNEVIAEIRRDYTA